MKEFSNNIAHSNGRFGLRILEMAPRKFPCEPPRDDTLEDPFSANPTYPAVFENFVTFSNHEVGVLGEILGTIIFKNMVAVDSKLAGF
jgi:hypothetical protein